MRKFDSMDEAVEHFCKELQEAGRAVDSYCIIEDREILVSRLIFTVEFIRAITQSIFEHCSSEADLNKLVSSSEGRRAEETSNIIQVSGIHEVFLEREEDAWTTVTTRTLTRRKKLTKNLARIVRQAGQKVTSMNLMNGVLTHDEAREIKIFTEAYNHVEIVHNEDWLNSLSKVTKSKRFYLGIQHESDGGRIDQLMMDHPSATTLCRTDVNDEGIRDYSCEGVREALFALKKVLLRNLLMHVFKLFLVNNKVK